MGLFNKTLEDLKKKVEKGTKFEALELKKIISKHIEEQHHFESDLTRLGRLISKYQEDLMSIPGGTDLYLENPENRKIVIQRINEAQQTLSFIKIAIKNLIKDKIKLE